MADSRSSLYNDQSVESLTNTLKALELTLETTAADCFAIKRQCEERFVRVYQLEEEIKQLRQTLQEKKDDLDDNFEVLDDETTRSPKATSMDAHAEFNARKIRRDFNEMVENVSDSTILSQITVVLARTLYTVNLGQIARVCANLGISDVRLVTPECNSIIDTQSRKYSGHAIPLLMAMPIYPSLQAAVADCSLVIGTSGKNPDLKGMEFLWPHEVCNLAIESGCYTINNEKDQSGLEMDQFGDSLEQEIAVSSNQNSATSNATDLPHWSTYYPQHAPQNKTDAIGLFSTLRDLQKQHNLTSLNPLIRDSPFPEFRAKGPRIAIIFGNEPDGMNVEELAHCVYCITIPTRGRFTSLNLAQAVTSVLFSIQTQDLLLRDQFVLHNYDDASHSSEKKTSKAVRQQLEVKQREIDDQNAQESTTAKKQKVEGESVDLTDQVQVQLKKDLVKTTKPRLIENHFMNYKQPLPPAPAQAVHAFLNYFFKVLSHQNVAWAPTGSIEQYQQFFFTGFSHFNQTQLKMLFGIVKHIQALADKWVKVGETQP